MNIVYPVRYNQVDLSVEDSHGKVIALVSWARDRRPLPEIHAIGGLMAESLNATQHFKASDLQAIRLGAEAARVDFLDKKDQSESMEQVEPERESKRPRGNPNWIKKAVV